MELSRRRFLNMILAASAAGAIMPNVVSRALAEAVQDDGPFSASWDSLARYKTPEWFRDAKFGIWAHWGPQCQAGKGDWYARGMYQEGSYQYKYQCEHYGHPSKAGFKEVIHDWKAESWDPEHLIALYKAAGAKYFMCLANHHDNFDNYASSHQPWNSVAVGPKKDLVGGWEKACRAAGLRFGVSVHAAHAWSWYETSQGADKNGPLAGVPYDGQLTKADGKGLWWDGLDPQDLYAQAHSPMGLQWEWHNNGHGDLPSAAYMQKFYDRTIELIDKYNPDQVYFDDTVLPFYPISDVGLKIAAHVYNRSMKRNRGRVESVINGKILSDLQRQCMVMDLERGVSNRIEPLPFQTDTCIGSWHYDVDLYNRHAYKSVDQVAHMLVDIVSKNGNLMLNIPLPGSGMPDSDELAFLAGFTKWMNINSPGIYGTRPWDVFGEGPSGGGPATRAQGFNESNHRYTAADFRFMRKGDTLNAFAMAWPEDGKLLVRSLANGAGKIREVSLLGYPGKLDWQQTDNGLLAILPSQKPCDFVYGLQIGGDGLKAVPVEYTTPTVEPGANGAIVVGAGQATIIGGTAQVENKDGVDNIGYWSDASDIATWSVDILTSGTYTVSAVMAAEDSAAGGQFDVEIGGRSLTATVESTGSWASFAPRVLGTLDLTQTGKQTLSVKPKAGAKWHGVNIRSLTLSRK